MAKLLSTLPLYFMIRLLLGFFTLFSISLGFANEELISLFPINHYDQSVNTWINPNDTQPLLSPDIQKKHFLLFQKKYLSPWDAEFINHLLTQSPPDDMKSIEKDTLNNFQKNLGFGENFRPHSLEWLQLIKENIALNPLKQLSYQKNNRAITIDSVYARVLPTDDPHFNYQKIAGEGFPFDNLQISAIWAGSPIYIISESKDHAWALVATRDFIGWVKTKSIARVSETFATKWKKQATKQLAAITKTESSLVDEKGHFLLKGYVGSVFPATIKDQHMQLWIPVIKDQIATIQYAVVSKNNATLMPLVLTPHHLANIIKTLQNRPYGWGNLYFYNDCSSELKNLFTPFGIWLPRHSAEQINIGRMVDLSGTTPLERITYLMHYGKKFLTLLYIGNHVVLYIGHFHNKTANAEVPMTYQNMWGLKPRASYPARRAIIGQSVFFPLLLEYPEDLTLRSQAASDIFKISFLDEL